MHTITLSSSEDVSAFVGALGAEGVFCEHTAENIWVVNVQDADAASADATAANMPAARAARLKGYAAAVRFNKEVGGTTVDGVAYPTDRETQSKMTAAVVMTQVNPAATFEWKVADGSFVSLNAAGMLAVALAVGGHVQAAFATEATVTAAIDAGTITTKAQVDAAFD